MCVCAYICVYIYALCIGVCVYIYTYIHISVYTALEQNLSNFLVECCGLNAIYNFNLGIVNIRQLTDLKTNKQIK